LSYCSCFYLLSASPFFPYFPQNGVRPTKLEITQPFPQELELTTKSARLAELDALLSMDKSAPMNNKSEKPSVLASLERGSSGIQKDTPQRRSDRPLDAAL